MVVSDILRAAIVLVLPIAAVTNIVLVYPLIFLVTSDLGLLPAGAGRDPAADRPRARPAERQLGAVGRRDDRRRHRLPAGGHLRGAARHSRPDRVLVRQRDVSRVGRPAGHDRRPGAIATSADRRRRPARGLPRRDEGRLATSSAARRSCSRTPSRAPSASSALGIAIALTPSFVKLTYSDTAFGWQAAYGFLETGLGLGNLVGGFVIGLVGARFAKGRMVIAGYAAWGLLIFLFALVDNLPLAMGLAFGQGVANMVFIIPSQTLFQERTPPSADGSRRRLPVRARLRVDDDGDGDRVGARRRCSARRRSSRPSGS